MRIVLCVVVIGALAAACGTPRYDQPPDDSWKDRILYCWFIQADPYGDDNGNEGYTDERPIVVDLSGGGWRVQATNVRAAVGLRRSNIHGDPSDDYFFPSVLWTVGERGSLRVERRC